MKYASLHLKGNAGWNRDGKQEIRQGKQPDAAGLRRQQAKKIHHVPRREQPLRMGNEQATPEKRFQMKTCYAHRGGDSKEKRDRKGWMDS